jgi:DNA polymerase-3 subunit epsilon
LGACHGAEIPELYNQRLNSALEGYQLQIWPYSGPILIEERNAEDSDQTALHLIDNWRYIKKLTAADELFECGLQTMDSSNVVAVNDHPNRSQDEINFDLDIYFILVRFLINDDRMKMNNIKIWPLMGIAPENFDY